ncbi:putative ABC exporter domain-containing protein [Aureliella helgolandensis]|uniref:Uncharacterized protein n=1 Tax=Aureliella helgolandensis TaxID=2527968 RepID=A0A518G088_9BACT|nr:putative ABC exporter domain-containing protein [Aureliella helgolandensis]QDV22011.1 hypothetical protein Q31a_02900 [Aureliella helgolandensis]
MHRALWYLLWLDFRGSLRSVLNIRNSWRQVVLLLLMLLFVGMIISARAFDPSGSGGGRFGAAMPFWALLYLLATWLTASADRGLVMRPAEVHFIVGGPFRSPDVITLNLVRLAFRSLISATVLSLIATAYVSSFPAALMGMWLLIVVSLLIGMIASLSARSAHTMSIKRLRRLVSMFALAGFLMLIIQAMGQLREHGEVPQISTVAAAAINTPIGRVILPPLGWMFAPLSSANFFPDACLLMPARLAVLGLLIAMVYALGGRYAEASTNRTDQSVTKRQNALRSGIAGGAGAASWTRRLRVPMPAALGGIGSVAWMQMTHSLRILPRYLIFTAAIVGLVLVVPLMVDPDRLKGWGMMSWMTGLTLYADFLLLLQLPVGFLGPVSQREMLKSLPIPSWRIVVGQLAGPLLPVLVLHSLVASLFLYLVPQQRSQVLVLSLALLPAALVVTANVNLLGMWNIIRPKALQQRDALAAGRAMASVWIFFAMLIPAIFVSAACAGLLAALTGVPMLSYLIGGSLGALLSSSIYISLLARAFRKWQPSSREGGQEEVEHDR